MNSFPAVRWSKKPNSFKVIWINLGAGSCNSSCGIKALDLVMWVAPFKAAVSNVLGTNKMFKRAKAFLLIRLTSK